MGSSWEDFVEGVSGNLARSYMFEWILPPIELLGTDADYKLRATSIPESSVEELSTYWQGQQYKTGGSRRFNDWTVTLMCDNGGFLNNIRSRLEYWMNEIHLLLPYYTRYGVGETNLLDMVKNLSFSMPGYNRPQLLAMLDDDGENHTLWVGLVDSWPKSIGQISLDHTSTEFATFDVTFSYSYHIILAV